jgi:hypothetical protein
LGKTGQGNSVTDEEIFTPVVNLAYKRALAYGAYHYQTVKKICERNLCSPCGV